MKDNDDTFLRAGSAGTWNITIKTQPARSPELNVNDLAFFRSLQSRYWLLGYSKKIEEIVEKVKQAYNKYPVSTIDKSWVALASVLDKILKHNGANGFAIPHMGKDKLLRESLSLPVAVQALEEALERV